MDASNFSRLIQLLLCTLGYISVISIYYLPGWMAIDIYLFTCILRLWAPWGQVRHLIHYCIPSPSFVSSTQPDTWSSMCSTCVFWDDVLISWALVWLLSLCLLFTLIIPPPTYGIQNGRFLKSISIFSLKICSSLIFYIIRKPMLFSLLLSII